MATRSEFYKARAVECEKIAADTVDFKIRDTFGGLASQWRKLAADIETLECEGAAVAGFTQLAPRQALIKSGK